MKSINEMKRKETCETRDSTSDNKTVFECELEIFRKWYFPTFFVCVQINVTERQK